MSKFGETLFGGSPFIRWSLTPVLLFFLIFVPLNIQWTVSRAALVGFLDLICIAMLAGFWLPSHIGRWAFRVVTGLVFIAYTGYLIDMFFFAHKSNTIILGGPGEASPINAVFGFIIIGIPCAMYALFGRFLLREPDVEPKCDDVKPELEEDEHSGLN